MAPHSSNRARDRSWGGEGGAGLENQVGPKVKAVEKGGGARTARPLLENARLKTLYNKARQLHRGSRY